MNRHFNCPTAQSCLQTGRGYGKSVTGYGNIIGKRNHENSNDYYVFSNYPPPRLRKLRFNLDRDNIIIYIILIHTRIRKLHFYLPCFLYTQKQKRNLVTAGKNALKALISLALFGYTFHSRTVTKSVTAEKSVIALNPGLEVAYA